MRIGIMGSGGVGGYFGARLAAAGHEVTFIARGAHLAAIRERGLRVESALGDVHVHPASATDDPAEVGPVETVLFATKLYDVEAAAERCRGMVGPETVVVALPNGIDAEERLAAVLGAQHVAGGVAQISAEIAEPGLIRHHGEIARMIFGELDGRESERLRRLERAAREAGVSARFTTAIETEIWNKFVFLVAMAGLTALTRLPVGPIRENPRSRRLLERAVDEAVAVAAARGVALGEDPAGTAMTRLDAFAPGIKASMLVDLERGNRLELDWLTGALCRLGEELGVPTPVHDVIWGALSPFAEGRPGA